MLQSSAKIKRKLTIVSTSYSAKKPWSEVESQQVATHRFYRLEMTLYI